MSCDVVGLGDNGLWRLGMLELRAPRAPKARTLTTCDSAKGDLVSPQKRVCLYYFLVDGKKILLGETAVPQEIDEDDAFPLFHARTYSAEHYEQMIAAIRKGAVVIAEPAYEAPSSLLAYTMGNPDYWSGREATLKYFGVRNFRPAV